MHTNLFVQACQMVEEQIKIVNQTLLLEKMHRTEECDPLLVDTDSVHNLSGHQASLPAMPFGMAVSQPLVGYHSHHHSYQHQHSHESTDGDTIFLTRDGALPLSRHAAKFVQRPSRSSLRLKSAQNVHSSSSSYAMRIASGSHNSLSDSNEEEDMDAESNIGELVRYKYGPGYFSCDMVWHCWFPIHHRLRSAGTDNGFIGLRVGLEQLAVRNRSNMYVYREKSKNIVYMRLYSSADSVFANIPIRTESWRDEVLANIGHSVLLAVHGVNPPGEEITVQLCNVLQRRLNKKTLEEIQNALLKNAHIRLEWSDIHFIQNDPQRPDSVLYFTVPSVAKDYLLAVKHYFTQQLQTFCILPKFREQSGLYAGSPHCLHQHHYHQHGYHAGTHNHTSPFQSHHAGGHSASNILKSHSSSGDFSTTTAATTTVTGGSDCGCECGDATDAMRRSQHAPCSSGFSTPPLATGGAATPVFFLPFVQATGPMNPRNYTPTFFLFNKPAGEGKRDTGIACLEMKLVDWEGAVIEDVCEAGFQASTRSLLYPSVLNADRMHRAERFQLLSKCLQIQNLAETSPINGTCALFQFNIWKNGNVEMDELQARLKMCAQQAISDLITEFGLLSAPIFETGFRSNVGSFSFPVPKSASSADSVAAADDGDGSSGGGAIITDARHDEVMATKLLQFQRQNAQDVELRQNVVLPNVAPDIRRPVDMSTTSRRVGITADSSTESTVSSTTTVAAARKPPKRAIHRDNDHVDIGELSDASVYYEVTPADGNSTRRPLLKQNSQQLTTGDTSGGTDLMQGPYQYFQKATRPSGTATSSTTLAYAFSSVSPFLIAPQNFSENIVGTTAGVTETISGASVPYGQTAEVGVENLLFDNHQYQTQQIHQQTGAVTVMGTSMVAAAPSSQHHYLQQQRANASYTPASNEFLRADFVAAAAEWFDHVYNTTKGFPEMSHSVRKFNFLLDCYGSARKIVQVIYERLKLMLRAEKVVLCRGTASSASTTATSATYLAADTASGHGGKHLQALLSVTPLLEPFEKDFGRIVFMDDVNPTELVLVAYPERQCVDTLQYGSDLSAPIPATLQKLVADNTQNGTYSKFLPSLRPFVPRQRVMYLMLNDENVKLFFYNYNNEVVQRVKEVVERAILWHNARSRLLREIGLQKMGVTHMSTLKRSDSKFNSYLLLTWLNPEVLVRNDYPVENLTTPDFSKLPRTYAQFLLKLYRFSDPAFVAKNLNVFPFEDQTQQMLTLREDVRSMLNEHRIFSEIHKQLLNQRLTLSYDFFNRIISRSRQVHYVQSPLLFFPSWRRIIASVRSGENSNTKRGGATPARRTSTVSSRDFIKRSKTIGMDSSRTTSAAAAGMAVVEEPCLVRVQLLLLENYVAYLRMLGLNPLNIIQSNNKSHENSLGRSLHYESPSNGAFQSSGSVGNRIQLSDCRRADDLAENIRAPANNAWLFTAMQGGVLFVQLCYNQPYFCVRIYQWNNTRLVSMPNSPAFKAEVESLRQLEKKKNELIHKCHVHSFTYDFHLRVVSRYLIGGKQSLLNPGYNTSAFLTDFLQYYECRPPNARNCLYEETLKCSQLQVCQSNIWEFFLDNKTQFAWNVIRLKMTEANVTDEFMLVSKDETQLLHQTYRLMRIVLSNHGRAGATTGQHHHHRQLPHGHQTTSVSSNSVATLAGSSIGTTTRDNEIALKFYVLLINEEKAYPITDELKLYGSDENLECSDHNPSGEFKRVYKTTLALSMPADDGDSSVDQSRRSSIGQSFNQHYHSHRSMVGAKFSYCCDSATANATTSGEHRYAADNETRVRDLGDENIGAALLAERRRSARSVTQRLKITASASEIADADDVSCSNAAAESEARLFFADFDDVDTRKRFSSGGNLDKRYTKQRLTKFNATSARRISDAPSILPTSLSVALPNLSRLFVSNAGTAETAAATAVTADDNDSGGESTELDASNALAVALARSATCNSDEAPLSSSPPRSQSPTSYAPSRVAGEMSFQKIPPRRHFRFGYTTAGNCSERGGAIVPSEQIIYFHYLSGVQRKLQAYLERIVEEKRAQLLQFVHEADRLCYVDMLWKSLLSSKSTHIRRPPTTIFSTATNSKSDLLTSSESSAVALNKSLKLSGSVEMDPADFAALLNIVRVEPMAAEEPRLGRLLANANFASMCRFLLYYYESEHRCRYFVQDKKSYLIITNPSFLDSAAMLRNIPDESPHTEIFLLFKNGVSRTENEPFAVNAIHKLFEDIVTCLSAFTWSELLHNSSLP